MIGIAARCPCCIAPMPQPKRSIWVKSGHRGELKECPLNGIERSLSFRIIRPEIPGPIPYEPTDALFTAPALPRRALRRRTSEARARHSVDRNGRSEPDPARVRPQRYPAADRHDSSVPVEKRSLFLERVAARLRLRGPRFTDADLGAAIHTALTGLIQSGA